LLHVIAEPADFRAIQSEWSRFANYASGGSTFSSFNVFLESWNRLPPNISTLKIIEVKLNDKHYGYLPLILTKNSSDLTVELKILGQDISSLPIRLPLAWNEIKSNQDVAGSIGTTILSIGGEFQIDGLDQNEATEIKSWVALAKSNAINTCHSEELTNIEPDVDVNHTNFNRGKKTLILTIGHVCGVILGIIAPMILSRHFPVDDFGIYRQFIAITWLLGLTAHLGMDSGLFYFVRREPEKAAMYSLNASVFNFFAATIIGLSMITLAPMIGKLLNVPEIAAEMPYIAAYLIAVLPGQHLPFYLLIRNRIGNATVFAVINASANAIAAIVGCLYFGSVRAVIIGLTTWGVIKLGWIAYLHGANEIHDYCSKFLRRLNEFKSQIKFGIPLGLATIVTVAAKLDRFIVSAFFGLRAFTSYSIGCFDLPLLPSIIDSISSLMVVDMVKKGETEKIDELKRKRVLSIWLSTVTQISIILIPSVIFAMIFAEPLITMFFSETYSSSAIYFQIYLVSFFLLYIDPDHVFHGLAHTKTSFKINSIGAVISISFMLTGLYSIGIIGVLLGRIIGEAITSLIRFKVLGHYLSAPMIRLMPWKQLSLISLSSGMSGLASLTLFNQLSGINPSAMVIICAVNFGVLYLLSSLTLGTLKLDMILSFIKKKAPFARPKIEKLNRGTL
jgi:O-antigen/teichoic acid export membrane protein